VPPPHSTIVCVRERERPAVAVGLSGAARLRYSRPREYDVVVNDVLRLYCSATFL